MSGESWNNGRSPFMPRKSLDIGFSEYPLDQERNMFLSLPSRRGLKGQGMRPLQVHRAEPYAPGGVTRDTIKEKQKTCAVKIMC